jgi:TolB protein
VTRWPAWATIGAAIVLFSSAGGAFSGRNARIVFVSNRAPNLDRPRIYSTSSAGSGTARKLSSSPQPEAEPALSPDGRRIAFLRGDSLYVMGADGRNPRELADGAASSLVPAWSPDGSRIAFTLGSGGIGIVSSAGGTVFVVTTDGTGPSWAPDGRSLAFQRGIPVPRGRLAEIHVIRADGTADVKIADGFSPAWSPRGSQIAFLDLDFHLVVAAPDGSNTAVFLACQFGAPAWSPDGNSIAVSAGGARNPIVVVGASATGPTRKLTRGPHDDYDPSWSRTGTKIVFTRRDASADPAITQLWTVDANGRHARPVTSEPPGSEFPGYFVAGDGRRIVFATEQITNDGDVYAVDADGRRLRRLTDDLLDEHWPKSSADGSKIVLSRGRGINCCGPTFSSSIYTMGADGRRLERITSPRNDFDVFPSWSPDGRRIAFERISGNGWTDGEAYVVKADGTGLRRVSEERGEYTGLAWSPDGRAFAFTRGGRVLVMGADGSDVRQVSAGPAYWPVSWSRDSRRIAFSRGPLRGIGVVDADGTGETVLVPDVTAAEVAWSPDGMAIAFRNGRFRIAVADIATGSVSVLHTGAAMGADYEPDWQGASLMPRNRG